MGERFRMRLSETLRVAVPGGELHVERSGAGTPAVLLHAGTLDSSMWDQQVDALATEHTVIRYDARSHGRSSTATTDYRDDEDLAAVLDACEVDSAALVGLSLGGRIAADFAFVRPERVSALVLSAPGITPLHFTDPFVLDQLAEQQEAIKAADAERYVEALLRYAVDGPQRQPDDVDPVLRRRCHDMAMGTVAAHATATGAPKPRDVLPHLDQITAPTLLMIGDLDLPDLHRVGDHAEKQLSQVRRLDIAGAGHMLNMEQPDQFSTAVLDHLSTHVETG